MGGRPKIDTSAADAAAKQMQQATEKMIRDNQYQADLQRVQSRKAQVAQAQQNAPLQMIQPPQPIQVPQPAQSQSAVSNAAANPSPQGYYGSAQQAKLAALGTGAGASPTPPVNAARPSMSVAPKLNSFNAPEVNNIKFGGM